MCHAHIMVDIWSHVPLYAQLAALIRTKIDKGEYKPGDRIPSEHELEQAYNVSRGTARKALDVLRLEGKIVTFPGRGSFVPPKTTK